MVIVFLVFIFLWCFSYGAEKNLEIESNYPLPQNNIQKIFKKTGDIELIIDFLKKTGDFEKVLYKNGKLYLYRKLRLKKVHITGNKSFWRREILAVTGLIEGYPVDTKVLHNIYTRLKKFYMDNGFPFVDMVLDTKIDISGNAYVTLKIKEGKEGKIGDLLIYGSKEIDKNLKKKIVKASKLEKGETFKLTEVTNSIDRIQQFLYDLDYFDSFVNLISLKPEEDRVNILIYIDFGMKYKIHFDGNRHFSEERLKNFLTFRENGFNYYQLISSTQNIENFYRNEGFLDVKVIPSFLEDYKKMETDIYLNIYEGKRYTVRDVNIKTDYPPVRTLLKRLKNQVYREGFIKNKLQELSDRFYMQGYLNTHYSVERKINRENKTVDLLINFHRGKKFILNSLNIQGVKLDLELDLPKEYRPEELIQVLSAVKKKIKNDGYLDGDAYLEVDFHEKNGFMYADAKIKTKKGKRYINGITFIYGTWHLVPEVIENNLSKEPYYTKEDFDNELDFLYYTSVFDSVNPYLLIDKKNKTVNKEYVLHEDKRGSFQGIIGYSSEQKLKLSAAISLKNLLKYGFEFSGYAERTDLGLFYRLTAGNRMLPKRTGAFLSLLKSYQYHRIYDIENQGLDIKLSRKPNRWIKHTVELSYVNNTLKNQSVYPDTDFNTLKLRFSIIDNHRKPDINPYKGYYLSGLIEKDFKDIDFIKVYGSGRYYKKFLFFVFTQKISLGYILKKTKKLPPSERFFLGGISSLRGFGYEEVSGEKKEGGNSLFLLNSEIRYPLFPSFNLYGFSFVDLGNVYYNFSTLKKLKMRKTAGTGIYLPTPVGSFLFDVAFKLDKKKEESLYRLEFSINTLF
ncbi:outer membrane protein insertion porin family [Persephonella hydrogeniphila]|uniref:Outer membrane protein insertion porin family n=1 Tax=Persephonella hydrogeniphila TaxID=198703 RepID=A0A285NGH5_9AQUI|nr:BamA/TamA family outer membrane protein [Persephonella hydrogeniphila]SNZ06741.1 outer membrane protein insertion porin family [Persephonella hydrogeniphila]